MKYRQEIEGSSAIQAFEYDLDVQVLTIIFTSGGRYDYPDVPPQIVLDWLEADSKGKFFNQIIKPYAAI